MAAVISETATLIFHWLAWRFLLCLPQVVYLLTLISRWDKPDNAEMTQFRDSVNTDPITDDKVYQTSHTEQKFTFTQSVLHPLYLTP